MVEGDPGKLEGRLARFHLSLNETPNTIDYRLADRDQKLLDIFLYFQTLGFQIINAYANNLKLILF